MPTFLNCLYGIQTNLTNILARLQLITPQPDPPSGQFIETVNDKNCPIKKKEIKRTCPPKNHSPYEIL